MDLEKCWRCRYYSEIHGFSCQEMSFSFTGKLDFGLTSAVKGSYIIDAVATSVANMSFENFMLLGIGDFISHKVKCVHSLFPSINQYIYHLYYF